MTFNKKSPFDCSVEELDRELILRGSLMPEKQRFCFADKIMNPNRDIIMKQTEELYSKVRNFQPDSSLKHVSTEELVDILLFKTRNPARGIWGKDERRDCFQIFEEPIKRNANAVAAICTKDDLREVHPDTWELNTKMFGKAFNLCFNEPFYRQPIANGPFSTGFLVGEDIVATAGHCVHEKSVTNLRFLFGYRMNNASSANTRFPGDKIFKGIKVLNRSYDRKTVGPDWAFVKLDRKVENVPVTHLSERDIEAGEGVYVIGFPCGLPLKYAPGAQIGFVGDSYFSADLDIYCGSSGSPVFNSITHKVVGLVVRGHDKDFRWSGRCWVSVIYSNPKKAELGAQCTKVSEFFNYC